MYSKQPLEGCVPIPQPKLCEMLGKTRSGLYKLLESDSTFPKPFKPESSRQAHCCYVAEEINAWLRTKINDRDSV